MDFDELMRLARVHVSNTVPDQSRQSLPVPARSDQGLRIGFFFAPSQALPGVNRLAPPHFVAWLHPRTGMLLELQSISPASLGQRHETNQMIGEFRLPQGMTTQGYLTQQRQLFDLYQPLVAAWDGGFRPTHEGLQPPAQEFLRLFALVSEPPLIPYYYAIGAPFFDWVRTAAKG